MCFGVVLWNSAVSNSLHTHGLQPSMLLFPWNSPGKNTGVGCLFLLQGIFLTQGSSLYLLHLLNWQADSLLLQHLGFYSVQFSSVAQSCPTLCDPRDSSPPGFPVPGILQARTLEWVAISFSRGSSQPRIELSYPMSLALIGRFFTTEPMWKNSVWKILKNKWSGFLKNL